MTTARVLMAMGTRPEAIKLASLAHMLRDGATTDIHLHVLTTGQHTDLLAMTTDDLDFRVDLACAPLPAGRDLPELLQGVIANVALHLRIIAPALLIVQGDTTSALGSALAAFNLGIPICHVEAGLRSFRYWDPFPEEGNRRLLSRLASFHLATSAIAKANLVQEGIEPSRIFLIRNPIQDALIRALSSRESGPSLRPRGKRILFTMHRREDRKTKIATLTAAVRELSEIHQDAEFQFVWHPSLDADLPLFKPLLDNPRFEVVPPQPYSRFVTMLRDADVVVTDSGGVSEEAALLGIPLVVFRRITEREDLVNLGVGVPVGIHVEGVVEGVNSGLETPRRNVTPPQPDAVARTMVRILVDLILPVLGEAERTDLR